MGTTTSKSTAEVTMLTFPKVKTIKKIKVQNAILDALRQENLATVKRPVAPPEKTAANKTSDQPEKKLFVIPEGTKRVLVDIDNNDFKMSVSFFRAEEAAKKFIPAMQQLEEHAQSVEDIKLRFADVDFWDGQVAAQLTQTMSQFKNLRAVKIDSSSNINVVIEDQKKREERKLSYTGFDWISQLGFLLSLHINRPLESHVNQGDMKGIINAVNKHSHLVSLSLKLPSLFKAELKERALSEADIPQLCEGIEKMKDLKKLTLDFTGRVLDSKHITHICRALSALTSIEHLKLNLSVNNLKDKDIATISETLSKLYSLTDLRLILIGNDEITDTGIASLTTLKGLHNLENLMLNLSATKITDASFKTVPEWISELSKLTGLTLAFKQTNVSDIGLRNLGSRLSLFENLKTLSLDFNSCKSIHNEGVADLTSSLPNELSSLTLNFRSCGQLTDLSVASVTKEVQKLTNIASLNLFFTYCDITSDAGLYFKRLASKFGKKDEECIYISK